MQICEISENQNKTDNKMFHSKNQCNFRSINLCAVKIRKQFNLNDLF